MAITVYETCTERQIPFQILNLHDSSTPFAADDHHHLSATFRDNIRSFLSDYAEVEDYTVAGNTVSCVFLTNETTGVVFPLFIIEEQISDSSPADSLCATCRCVGWGHHYVSKRKYHLIIPRVDEWKQPLTEDSLEDTDHHLMHGAIHCNGFGHLLCVNTDDSNYLSGDQIMSFWDRLCSTLQTRKISLDDTSRKGSMDLRLLHGVAYGRPWFGKWGYTFSHGSFGVKEDQYSRAIHILSSIELDKIMEDFSGTRNKRAMNMIIGFYRASSTETPLVTLSDLLRYMLAFSFSPPVQRNTAMALAELSLTPASEPILVSSDSETDTAPDDHVERNTNADIIIPKYDSFDTLAVEVGSRYPARRLKDAAQAVIQVFEGTNSVITRQDLRKAVRGRIGDTGLIDFLLKHIDKVRIGDKIIQRSTNPSNRMLQFSLWTINPGALDQELGKKRKQKRKETDQWRSNTPGSTPYEDILYLYENLLVGYLDSEVCSNASEVILSCKAFVKEWPLPSNRGNLLTVSCQILPNHDDLLGEFTRKLPPGELVMVPKNATIKDLKSAAEEALKDTYFVTDEFEVLEIRNRELELLDDDLRLDKMNEREFLVKGFGLDIVTELRYEGGFDDWIVDCKCGARDDDGERMVSCDVCKVWHHTSCNSIEDEDDEPSEFRCDKCCGESLRSKKRSAKT